MKPYDISGSSKRAAAAKVKIERFAMAEAALWATGCLHPELRQ